MNIDYKNAEQIWRNCERTQQVKSIADNNKIYHHLFGDYAYFYPVIDLVTEYSFDDEMISPIYFGNLMKPKEVSLDLFFMAILFHLL